MRGAYYHGALSFNTLPLKIWLHSSFHCRTLDPLWEQKQSNLTTELSKQTNSERSIIPEMREGMEEIESGTLMFCKWLYIREARSKAHRANRTIADAFMQRHRQCQSKSERTLLVALASWLFEWTDEEHMGPAA